MIYLFENMCSLTNYADVNTLYHSRVNSKELKLDLENGASTAITWYNDNDMKANHSTTRQGLVHLNAMSSLVPYFNIGGLNIEIENNVKLLGVIIDDKLKFDAHVTKICKKKKRLNK